MRLPAFARPVVHIMQQRVHVGARYVGIPREIELCIEDWAGVMTLARS